MTQDPTPYDLLQDAEISALQDIVTPYYTPPGDVEYSFPVVGQGITADQYRQMSLAQGDGIIHRGYRPYYLEGHATAAETNQRNTLILKVDSQHDYSESIIGGFYHRLTGNMELSFPPVTTSTDYHVCVTYDPRREDEETGPAHIEVYAGEPPRTHGRQHNILNVVQRQPNQLLSDANIIRYRQAVAPAISVQNASQLPNPNDVLYGTIAALMTPGTNPSIFISQGTRWAPLNEGMSSSWSDIPLHNNGSPYGSRAPQYKITPHGVILRGAVRSENRSENFGRLPEGARPATMIEVPVATTGSFSAEVLRINSNGQVALKSSQTSFQNIFLEGVFFQND